MSAIPQDGANGTNGTNGVNGTNGANHQEVDAGKLEQQQQRSHIRRLLASSVLSTSLPPDDPANPQHWPLYKKIMTSIQGWLFGFTVALGITCFTAGKVSFAKEFGLNPNLPEEFIAAFSLYIFGIVFAPYWAPHLVERVGRTIPYFITLILNALFNLGAARSHHLVGVQVCRFFAGLFGGYTLVSLEGTFADMWSPDTTNTYYAFQGLAAFFGAALGPVVGGQLVGATGGWRWTQYFPVCLAAAVLLTGISMPETYQREIPRRRGRYSGRSRAEIIAQQEPAQSGATLGAMFKTTVIQPFTMFFTEPVVTLTSTIMFFTFATTFQWFISVPAALGTPPPKGPGFSIQSIGLAFLGAVVGSFLGALTVAGIEIVMNKISNEKMERAQDDSEALFEQVEYRVVPSMLGIVFMTIGLFWVGNTVNPNFKPIVPITGTAFFVWGSSMVTFSIIPYLFDTFSANGTLSAITAQAVGRLLAAAFLPFLILQDITSSLTPVWGLGVLGFISLGMWPIPVLLFFFGARWRMRSKYSMMKDE